MGYNFPHVVVHVVAFGSSIVGFVSESCPCCFYDTDCQVYNARFDELAYIARDPWTIPQRSVDDDDDPVVPIPTDTPLGMGPTDPWNDGGTTQDYVLLLVPNNVTCVDDENNVANTTDTTFHQPCVHMFAMHATSDSVRVVWSLY